MDDMRDPAFSDVKQEITIYAVRSRGHSSTSSDAIIQHATIKINPPRNEPVRWLRSPMILGPKNPPMLAVQLMKPTAAAAAELVRNEDGQRPERWQICHRSEADQREHHD